jgi:hypothetical protein
MEAKYLLYIDILGFGAMAGSDAGRVVRLYSIIDSLNVHRHSGFRTIVFSDTILVYNDFTPRDEQEHDYAVMFACEFAQDLLVRLVEQDVYFRALLEYGEFSSDKLTNIQSVFGPALVRAYQREKQLQAVGLFATAACVARNRVFPTERFQDDLYFVFLNQSLERLQRNTGGQLPSDPSYVDNTDDYHRILWDLSFLASVHRHMRGHSEQRVRAKHLATYDLYRRRYPDLLAALEAARFQPECICPTHDWSREKAHFRDGVEATDA